MFKRDLLKLKRS